MSTDTELLRRYVEERSESAFTDFVREHLNLVYSAALRETSGDAAEAEDLSQAVFTELARKAPRLLGHPSLAGWVYTTVRRLAANLRRAERRRRRREQEAQTMIELHDSPHEAWQQLRPVLDDALHELKEADREAVVLRFLEDRPLREVGARLGLSENAARMRVDRALEKLRGRLAVRGITSAASGLAAALAIGALTPPPAALAATIAGAALASGAAAGSSTFTLMKLMSLTKAQAAIIGAVVVAGLAVPAWQQTRLHRARAENEQLRAHANAPDAAEKEVAALRAEVQRLRGAKTDAAELEQLRQYKAQTQPELLRLRGMAGLARRATAEAEQSRAQLKQQASQAGTNFFAGLMADAMKQTLAQQTEAQLARMTASLHLTPEQVQAVREILGRQTQAMSAGMEQAISGKGDIQALLKLGKETGDPDAQIKALLTPEQQAAYPAYEQAEAAHNASLAANSELLRMQVTLGLTADQQDQAYAVLYGFYLNQLTDKGTPKASSSADPVAGLADFMQQESDRKAQALQAVLTPSQMETYRQQEALTGKALKDTLSRLSGGAGGAAPGQK
jgi:RNA polymerase sigma factor (sigma-70 family)